MPFIVLVICARGSLNLVGRGGSEGDTYAALAGGVEGGGPGLGAVGEVLVSF